MLQSAGVHQPTCRAGLLQSCAPIILLLVQYTINRQKVTERGSARGAGRPGIGPIVQVCSSTTHPAPTRLLHTITCGYLNEAPPAALGRHARKNYVVDILRSDAAFRARCLAHNVRVGSMCAMLRLAGEGKAAKKVPPCL